jgi:hypothetical protein
MPLENLLTRDVLHPATLSLPWRVSHGLPPVLMNGVAPMLV